MEQLELEKKLWDFLAGKADLKTRNEIKTWLCEDVKHQEYFNDFRKEYLNMRWALRRKLIKQDHFSELHRKIRRHVLWRRMQIAASIVILVGVVGLVRTIWFASPQEKIMARADDIRPGKSQAILVLSEGEKIPIAAINTELEETDGTHIKVDDRGEVHYQIGRGAGKTEKMVYNQLVIPRGGEFTMVLSDGTKVWLNAATEMKYPTKFLGKERTVYLKGEAYFDVKSDTLRPFIVKTDGKVNIKVLGTEFNVNTYTPGKVETVLVEGSVGITNQQSKVKIKPGDKADCLDGQANITVEQVDVIPYIAWKDGNFVFQNQRLEEIMEKLSLWYDVDVFYIHDTLKEVRMSGDMKRYEEICDLLYFLEKSSGVKFKIQERTIIVDKY